METEQKTVYTVKTPVFEGPFNLLLSLIEERKLFINELSLSQVTEDYLSHVNNMETKDKEEMASFIVVASTLILIKSKSLFPNLVLSEEEEGDIKSLEERLRLYELYTKLSKHVKEKFGKNIIFQSEVRKNDILVFLPDERITKDQIMQYANLVLGKIPKQGAIEFPSVEVKKVVSLEEMIDSLTKRINEVNKMSWSNMHGKPASKEDKVLAIVSFLAMLELVRTGILDAIQDENFDEITIEKI